MTSATLFREGTDLEALLAELDSEHPGQVHVLEVNHLREGGVFGFFARPRVAVQYTLREDGATTPPALSTPGPLGPAEPGTGTAAGAGDPLAALIAAAEMVETGRAPEPAAGAARATGDDGAGNVEFARMLLDIAAKKAAERGQQLPAAPRGCPDLPAPAGGVPAAQHSGIAVRDRSADTPATAGPSALRPERAGEADERLSLRRRLAELGVPIGRIPADAVHRYAAVEHLVGRLPAAAPLPHAGDAVVVVAAPVAALARIVPLIVQRMSLTAESVWTFRGPRGLAREDRRLIETGDARALAAAVRRPGAAATAPALVAVGLDEDADDDSAGAPVGGTVAPGGPAAREIIAALAPDAFWLHVDATRKAADTEAAVRSIGGTPTALVVTGAARTTSPASVWQLDVPIAVLDGQPATRSAWAVLLLEKLAETDA